MSSIFGFYYVMGLLSAAGWPRRGGLFNTKNVINNLALDSTITQMIDWAACIGAYNQDLALQIIATMFRDYDWDNEGGFNIVKFVSDCEKEWKKRDENNENPQKAIEPYKFRKNNDALNVNNINKDVTNSKDLEDKRMQMALEQYFIEALIWGLVNPAEFKIYFETKDKKQRERLPEYEKDGLEIGSLPTVEQTLKNGEEIVGAYEKEVCPLSPIIPQKLIKDAISLGIEINN
jgi:hypothetical protein